ncbi:penicillin acylase family protein [Aurantiacibacter aquimixticola]|uniref:Acylase n=1 Tax=Aurantiacibacter aquimixticola TaxID=1958945 RepID=A0A419RS28_9SPHN|nr:penicillin acylase family protein [Aurantiacibacter aquimixticola]RJY08591.1 acylase [Aurantiacibacter aquimixticola]
MKIAAYSIGLAAICMGMPAAAQDATISWDEWGVPHIAAESHVDAAYAQGWAQARGRPDQLVELLVQARGTAASLWGPDYVQNDTIIWTSGLPAALPGLMAALEPEERARIDAYVDGINAFFSAYPQALTESRKRGLPITAEDVVAHSQSTLYLTFVAGRELFRASRLQQADVGERGSNGWAIAPSRSASGNSLLLMNPHLPWDGVFTWFETHVMAENTNIYGVALLGQPQATILFNHDLGWTHTVNTLDNADTYAVELTPGGGYIFDGAERAFNVTSHTLDIAMPDGSMAERAIPILRTVHGPVVARSGTQAFALRIAGFGDPDYANTFAQYSAMAEANNRTTFEAALARLQNPMFNTIYADGSGDILYVSGGLHPVREKGDAAFWSGVIDGGDASTLWTGYHPYESLLRIADPASGFVQNSNEPGFTATYPIALDPADYPADFVQPSMQARPQHGLQMLLADQSITFQEMVDYAHDTRLTLADNILDDLLAAARVDGRPEALRAADVLAAWDRSTNAESRGAALFTLWAASFLQSGDFAYEERWNIAEPQRWSNGLSDAAAIAAVDQLVATVERADAANIPLDLPWGTVARVPDGEGGTLRSDLGLGQLGAFRTGNFNFRSDALVPDFNGGTGWLAVVEFDDTPRAKALLPYGNFENRPEAIVNQLPLFSEGELREVYFTPDAVRAAAVYAETLERD